VRREREALPDAVAAAWAGGLVAAPAVAALCSYLLGPPIWVFLVPLLVGVLGFCLWRLMAGSDPYLTVRTGRRPVRLRWVLLGLAWLTAPAIVIGRPTWVLLLPLLVAVAGFSAWWALDWSSPGLPDRTGIRPVRLRWVLTRFGMLAAAAIVSVYLVAVIAAARG
jgi:hypothetical protein